MLRGREYPPLKNSMLLYIFVHSFVFWLIVFFWFIIIFWLIAIFAKQTFHGTWGLVSDISCFTHFRNDFMKLYNNHLILFQQGQHYFRRKGDQQPVTQSTDASVRMSGEIGYCVCVWRIAQDHSCVSFSRHHLPP